MGAGPREKNREVGDPLGPPTCAGTNALRPVTTSRKFGEGSRGPQIPTPSRCVLGKPKSAQNTVQRWVYRVPRRVSPGDRLRR
jgi:hypothetical protein